MNKYKEIETEIAVRYGKEFISNDVESVINAYKVFATLSNDERNKISTRRAGFDIW